MSRTPAAELARLRVRFGETWRIDRTGQEFTAVDRTGPRRITASTLGQLEYQLDRTEWADTRSSD